MKLFGLTITILMLREEDGMDGEVTHVESKEREKSEDNEILGACPRESKRARVE